MLFHSGGCNFLMSSSQRLTDLQFRLEYYALRAVIAVVRSIPLETATAISAKTWSTLAPIINPKRHQRALENLKIAFPDKPEAELNVIRRKHWENLGRVMAETMQIDRITADPSRMERSGRCGRRSSY